jgi:DNA mismatch endonuclease, patch repair protein
VAGFEVPGDNVRKSGRYWRKKLASNQARDRLVTRSLRRKGWRVLRIWEHELSRKNEVRLLRRLRRVYFQVPLIESSTLKPGQTKNKLYES